MKPHRAPDGDRSLAVFIDFENMGLGFNNRRDRFEINKVLERLVEKGKIVAKKAYADWSRFGMYTAALHEAAIELVEIPRRGVSGKNSADIRLVVDAIDLAYSKDHIDTFVIVSGDSDFSPLVSKLKELGKHVIGLGLVDATSDLLRDNCDEFIYYEDLDRAPIIPVGMNDQIPERKRKVFALMLDTLLALRRENKEVIYSSMLKDTMKRKKPSFNEEYYGYRTFSELLEDAQREGLLELEKHKTSGMYIVTRFGLEMKSGSGVVTVRNGSEGRRALEAPKPVERAAGRGRAPERQPARGPQQSGKTGPIPLPTPTAGEAPALPPERPLGRALVEDVDDLEAAEVVPSYGARKSAARPAAPPKPEHEPRPKSEQRGRGGRGSSQKGTQKPATQKPTGQGRRRQEPKPAPAPRQAPVAPPAHAEDDEFGAGIGE
jgi:uncharacterized protein (TIGR00288 family)